MAASGRPWRAAVVTLGCPKNLVDSEVMAATLGRAGFELTGELRDADCIVINTCAFIAPAREEAWRHLRRAARLRRRGCCRALIVAGCLVQGFADEVRVRAPEADRLLGTGQVEEIAAAAVEALEGRGPLHPVGGGTAVGALPGYLPHGPSVRLLDGPTHFAYLKIAEGCDHRCAFCLIPTLRGPYRSRPPDDIIAEARALTAMAVKELVLVAQDTTFYGRDLAGRPLLAPLVRRLLDETDVGWVRVLYGCPSTLPDNFVALLAEAAAPESGSRRGAGRLCRYLDLPMQHASDLVLRAMRRPERAVTLLRLLERLRRDVPGLTLRSTFIVGFPGESDQDFEKLLGFLKEARLDHAGFFAYSREARTAAASLDRQVGEGTRKERLARAVATQKEIARGINRGLVGRPMRLLIDRVEPRPAGAWMLIARSEGDAPEIDGWVEVPWPAATTSGARTRRPADQYPGRPPSPGDFLEVVVTSAGAYKLGAEAGRPLA